MNTKITNLENEKIELVNILISIQLNIYNRCIHIPTLSEAISQIKIKNKIKKIEKEIIYQKNYKTMIENTRRKRILRNIFLNSVFPTA